MSSRVGARSPIPVPSPLPHTLPPALRTTLTEALFQHTTAIPDLQHTLSSSLRENGWFTALENYIVKILQSEEFTSTDMDPDEAVAWIMRKVLDATKLPMEANVKGKTGLKVPEQSVGKAARVLRDALQKICVVVDEEDMEVLYD